MPQVLERIVATGRGVRAERDAYETSRAVAIGRLVERQVLGLDAAGGR